MSSTTNTSVYTASNLITVPTNEPSVCIPRLFMNIQKERVYDVFVDLFGRNAIERVDMIERKNDAGEEYKRAFIHFKSWPRTEQATEVRLKLLNSEEVKIMYDQPWFWRISASRVLRPEDQRRRETRDEKSRPFIVIDEGDAKDTRRAPYQPRQQYTQDSRAECQQQQHRPQVQRHQERYDERRDHRDYRPQPRHQERYDQRDYYVERRDQRDYHRSQSGHQERYDERRDSRDYRPQPRRQEQRYNRRLESHRPPSIHITPTKTAPEIADWIEKSKQVPGAPVKSKKPRLVMSDEGGAGADDVAEDRTTDVKNRGRRLSFDEASSDDEAVPRVAPTPSTPPVPQQQPSETSSASE